MNYITRSLEKVVCQVTEEYPVVLVTGSRQVGKTTMLQRLMEGTDRAYVSLDDLNERNIAKNVMMPGNAIKRHLVVEERMKKMFERTFSAAAKQR